MIPESIAIVGGLLWGISALVMAGYRGRIPSSYSLLYSCVATVGILAGMTKWTGQALDGVLMVLAGVVYFLTPIAFMVYLLWYFDNEEASRCDPRRVT